MSRPFLSLELDPDATTTQSLRDFHPLNPGFQDLHERLWLSQEFRSILHPFCSTASAISLRNTSSVNVKIRDDLRTIEYRLLNFSNHESGASTTVQYVQNACRLAILLYISTILDDFWLPSQRNDLLAKFKTSIIELDAVKEGLTAFKLWLLSLGSVAASEITEETWFTASLQRLSQVKGISSREIVETVVRSFAWFGVEYDAMLKRLCDEFS